MKEINKVVSVSLKKEQKDCTVCTLINDDVTFMQ